MLCCVNSEEKKKKTKTKYKIVLMVSVNSRVKILLLFYRNLNIILFLKIHFRWIVSFCFVLAGSPYFKYLPVCKKLFICSPGGAL